MWVRDRKTGRFAKWWKAKRWPKRFKPERGPRELPRKVKRFLKEIEEEEGFLAEIGEDWEIVGDFKITEDVPYEGKHKR